MLSTSLTTAPRSGPNDGKRNGGVGVRANTGKRNERNSVVRTLGGEGGKLLASNTATSRMSGP